MESIHRNLNFVYFLFLDIIYYSAFCVLALSIRIPYIQTSVCPTTYVPTYLQIFQFWTKYNFFILGLKPVLYYRHSKRNISKVVLTLHKQEHMYRPCRFLWTPCFSELPKTLNFLFILHTKNYNCNLKV